jgi:hypothetical protein
MASLGYGSSHDAVTMRNAVFRLVLARATTALDDPADKEELEMAEAFGGIAFDQLEPAQRQRIARAVQAGLYRLKSDVAAGAPLDEPVHPDIADKLDELIDFMSAHLDARSG